MSLDWTIRGVSMYRNYMCCVCVRERDRELTHVTSKETKKSSATLVYPNAALFASMAALWLFWAMVDWTLGVMGGTSDLGLRGAEPIVTEYWS